MLWEPSTYTWLEKCEFLFCKEPGDLAKANILESICVKWSEILEYSMRESNGGKPLRDTSAMERNSDFFKNNFKAEKWPRTDHLNLGKI